MCCATGSNLRFFNYLDLSERYLEITESTSALITYAVDLVQTSPKISGLMQRCVSIHKFAHKSHLFLHSFCILGKISLLYFNRDRMNLLKTAGLVFHAISDIFATTKQIKKLFGDKKLYENLFSIIGKDCENLFSMIGYTFWLTDLVVHFLRGHQHKPHYAEIAAYGGGVMFHAISLFASYYHDCNKVRALEANGHNADCNKIKAIKAVAEIFDLIKAVAFIRILNKKIS
jgi:hypothetical protein